MSFIHNKNIANYPVRSVLKSANQPGCFKYARFMQNCSISFTTLLKFLNPSTPLKSLTVLYASPLMLSLA